MSKSTREQEVGYWAERARIAEEAYQRLQAAYVASGQPAGAPSASEAVLEALRPIAEALGYGRGESVGGAPGPEVLAEGVRRLRARLRSSTTRITELEAQVAALAQEVNERLYEDGPLPGDNPGSVSAEFLWALAAECGYSRVQQGPDLPLDLLKVVGHIRQERDQLVYERIAASIGKP